MQDCERPEAAVFIDDDLLKKAKTAAYMYD